MAAVSVGQGILTPGNIDRVNTKHGQTALLPAAANSDVWPINGPYTGQPTTGPVAMEAFSDNAADINVELGYLALSEFGDLVSGTVTLDGADATTPVSISGGGLFLRMTRVTVNGSIAPSGNITISEAGAPANIYAYVLAGDNKTQMAVDTVPAGTMMGITRLYITGGRANGSAFSASVSLLAREPGGVYRKERGYEVTDSDSVSPKFDVPIPLSPLTDIIFRIESVSDNDVRITAEFDYFTLPIL